MNSVVNFCFGGSGTLHPMESSNCHISNAISPPSAFLIRMLTGCLLLHIASINMTTFSDVPTILFCSLVSSCRWLSFSSYFSLFLVLSLLYQAPITLVPFIQNLFLLIPSELGQTALFELQMGWCKLEWSWKDCSKTSRWKGGQDAKYIHMQASRWCSGVAVVGGAVQGVFFVEAVDVHMCMSAHVYTIKDTEGKKTVSAPDCNVYTCTQSSSTSSPSRRLMQWLQSH